jgi:hypothetical protein
MNDLVPENFLDLCAAIFALLGIILGFTSLVEKLRAHTTRVLAIFFLFSIALFSDHAVCYFAALFIVATAITELDFLQNLAAIIRGSKEYFDYKKEFMSAKEVEESFSTETAEIEEQPEDGSAEPAESVELTLDLHNLSTTQFAMLCEEYAFKHLERRYVRPIERHVRYRGKGHFTEFDGVMLMDRQDLIFEIKVSRRRLFPSIIIKRATERSIERVKEYKMITKRDARLQMVFISASSQRNRSRFQDCHAELRERYPDVQVDFDILTFADIGLAHVKSKYE